jgi:hypothetical protein
LTLRNAVYQVPVGSDSVFSLSSHGGDNDNRFETKKKSKKGLQVGQGQVWSPVQNLRARPILEDRRSNATSCNYLPRNTDFLIAANHLNVLVSSTGVTEGGGAHLQEGVDLFSQHAARWTITINFLQRSARKRITSGSSHERERQLKAMPQCKGILPSLDRFRKAPGQVRSGAVADSNSKAELPITTRTERNRIPYPYWASILHNNVLSR